MSSITIVPAEGPGPLECLFIYSGVGVPNPVSWLWEFGDGRSSTLSNPRYIYRMPGVYNVVLTTLMDDGTTETFTATVYVYEQNVNNPDGFYANVTDFCFRHSIKRSQGRGVVEFGGDNWLWPPAFVGTCKGVSEDEEPLILVKDSRDGQIYQIGEPDLYTDKTSSYGGSEIDTYVLLPESTARQGEHVVQRLAELHVHMRARKKEYRGAAGYDADGFRTGHQVNVKLFEDGEQIIPTAELKDVHRLGDYTFGKIVEARRLQVGIETTSAAYRAVTVSQHLQEIDRKALPQDSYTVETAWQKEWSKPDFWLSRNKPLPLSNRANGHTCTGAYDGKTTGPDGKAGSATLWAPASYAGDTLNYMAGDFVLSWWMAAALAMPAVMWRFRTPAGVAVTVTVSQVMGQYRITLADGTNNIAFIMGWDGWAWVHVAIRRVSGVLSYWENGVQLSQAVGVVVSYGGVSRFADGASISTFDARRVPRSITPDGIRYYYADVTDNAGAGGCLP